MLFKPQPQWPLGGIFLALDGWNAEADRFRLAASGAQNGTAPSALVVAAAEEARDGLVTLLDEIDGALDALPAGHPDFSGLLQAQNASISLYESIGCSLDRLDRFVAVPSPVPTRIAHPRPPLAIVR